MTGKSNIEILMSNPEAMRRFQDALEQAATFVGINKEIKKVSESLRTQLMAGLVCGIDTRALLESHRDADHERLMVFASAVGAERGRHHGRARANEIISESNSKVFCRTPKAFDS